MSHIRLIGLLLFITAITLALAAAATRTTHVEVDSQWLLQFRGDRQPVGMESSTTIPPGGSTPTQYTGIGTSGIPNAGMPNAGGQAAPSSDSLQREHLHNWDYAAHQSQFQSTAIPIAWPLLATGAIGLLLWFIQAPGELRHSSKKRSSHRKRRR